MKASACLPALGLLSHLLAPAAAIELDLGSDDSIKSAAKTIAAGMTKYYTGMNPGDTPGNLPDPYYWWEAGAMFGALIEYWYYTGDKEYVDITKQAMYHQIGENKDYKPDNQTQTLGNDDQGFWGIAAMTAAEVNFPEDETDETPGWAELAQAVFNTQASEWSDDHCGGGLRWQIFQFNKGYDYKNTISNGCFFNLAARLAKYTGNMTYAEWAVKTWTWTEKVGFISDDYHLYDGGTIANQCQDTDKLQWTYNAGVFLYGSAAMWNITGSDMWKTRIEGLIKGLDVFYYEDTNILFEVACERNGKCNVDQRSFKAYLSRWLSSTLRVAPWTEPLIIERMKASAMAAAKTCTGGDDGQQCSMRWWTGQFDGSTGVGEQMSALEAIQGHLYKRVSGPLSLDTGAKSKSNPGAGGDKPIDVKYRKLSVADRVGAGIVTTLVLGCLLGGTWWMVA